MALLRSARYVRIHGCPYCGKAMDPYLSAPHPKMPTKDHVLPKSRGGRWCVTVCLRCNNDKADYTIREWMEMLCVKEDPRSFYVEQFMIKWARNIEADEARDAGRVMVEQHDRTLYAEWRAFRDEGVVGDV